jgi:hypothetical protein
MGSPCYRVNGGTGNQAHSLQNMQSIPLLRAPVIVCNLHWAHRELSIWEWDHLIYSLTIFMGTGALIQNCMAAPWPCGQFAHSQWHKSLPLWLCSFPSFSFVPQRKTWSFSSVPLLFGRGSQKDKRLQPFNCHMCLLHNTPVFMLTGFLSISVRAKYPWI